MLEISVCSPFTSFIDICSGGAHVGQVN